MTGVTAEQLLRLSVRLRGIHLGRATDVVLDRDRRRAVGIQVRCRDEAQRFLPLAAAQVEADEIAVSSPLVLLDTAELGFYTKRGWTFSALRGAVVARGGVTVGGLEDLVVGSDGAISTIVVDTPDGPEQVVYGDDVALG